MTAYVVTEGSFDAELLLRVLPKHLQEDVLFVDGGGLSGAKSLARSLLVRRRTPVALVMDADTVSPELIQERRQSAEELIGGVAANVPNKVVVAIPTLEVVLFQEPAVLEKLLGQPIPETIRVIARYDPREALDQLLAQSKAFPDREKLLDALSPQDTEVLQKAAPIQELTRFLETAREWAANGRAAPARA
jgi:hypothetical protein